MSKYTTEVRYICENASGLYESEGYSSTNEILDKAAPKVFNFDYPIYDENYRPVLEKKILRHYYTREIGEETVGLWKLRLEDRMNMIMPYYNKLYESELLKFDPLIDTNFSVKKDVEKNGKAYDDSVYKSENESKKNTNTENDIRNDKINKATEETANKGNSVSDHNDSSNIDSRNDSVRKSNDINDSNVTNNSNEWNLFSDTPQGGIVGIANAYSPNLADKSYLTDARNITGNDSGETHSTNESSGFDRSSANTKSDNEARDETNSESTGVVDSSGFERQHGVGETNTDENNTYNESGFNRKQRNAKNLEDYLETVTGKRGTRTYASMLRELRETFINIDAMIIDELSDLFMNLW